MVRREPRGNATDHTCIYHRWCYGLDGSSAGAAVSPRPQGQGRHGGRLQARGARPATAAGRVVSPASSSRASATTPSRSATISARCSPHHLDRLFGKPIRILGYQRQRIFGNWKLYLENTRDTYHGSLLHEFQSTFGTSRVTQTGGVTMDERHRHNLTWAKIGTDDDAEFSELYKEHKVHESQLRLLEPEMVEFRREFDDGISLAICSIFPNTTIHQIANSLATRQLRTSRAWRVRALLDRCSATRTTAEEMTQHRLLQANMVGPAGLISMEDGEAIEIMHRAVVSATRRPAR